MQNTTINVNCPHCNNSMDVRIREKSGKEKINCDVEVGGCDKDFMLKWSVEYKITHQTAKLKWGQEVITNE
jgi:hypothetical protein